jgi:hypothetical protein
MQKARRTILDIGVYILFTISVITYLVDSYSGDYLIFSNKFIVWNTIAAYAAKGTVMMESAFGMTISWFIVTSIKFRIFLISIPPLILTFYKDREEDTDSLTLAFASTKILLLVMMLVELVRTIFYLIVGVFFCGDFFYCISFDPANPSGPSVVFIIMTISSALWFLFCPIYFFLISGINNLVIKKEERNLLTGKFENIQARPKVPMNQFSRYYSSSDE